MPRKPKKYHYIYKTTNLVNGKWYIGMHSSDSLEDEYIGSGKMLWYSVKKYGRENFKMEILEFLPDRSSLALRESEIVNMDLLCDPLCMNLMCGGLGGFDFLDESILRKGKSQGGSTVFRLLNERHREKLKNDPLYRERIVKSISERTKGAGNPFFGKTHSEEFREKLRTKMSIAQKGENNSQFGMKWIHNSDLKKSIRVKNPEAFIADGWKMGRKVKWGISSAG